VPTVLLATDSDAIHEAVDAALDTGDTTVRRVRQGHDVLPAIAAEIPDLVVLDLQIGNMGGMAACMSIRLEEGIGNLPRLPVLMLLDRHDDVFLADRSDAEGWLIKPLDAFRLRRACAALLVGDQVREGVETPAEVTAPETA